MDKTKAKLIALVVLVGAALVAFDLLTGAEWVRLVLGVFGVA